MNLKSYILSENAKAEVKDINNLQILVDKYRLRWVPSPLGRGAYFIMNDVSKAKGLNAEDYRKHWSTNTERLKELRGRSEKLTGTRLERFKTLYKITHNKALGNYNSLWIGSWDHVLDYLNFNKLNSPRKLKKVSNVIEFPKPDISKPIIKINTDTEHKIQEDLIRLASYSNLSFEREVIVKNYIRDINNTATTRRYDLVRKVGNKVYIYELKKDQISVEHIITTIIDKGYMTIAKKHYSNKDIRLIFVSPEGIDKRANRLLECSERVEFKDLYVLAEEIYMAIEDKARMAGDKEVWFPRKRIIPQFPNLLHRIMYLAEAA